MMSKFKVGDRVKRRKNTHDYNSYNDKTFIVTEIDHLNMNLEPNIYKWGKNYCADYFELANDTHINESHLQDLVKKANEGDEAFRELRKLALNRIEYNISGEKEFTSHNVDELETLVFRLKPLAPKERKFHLRGWKCLIFEKIIKVGCKEFDRKQLQTDLKYIIENNFPYIDIGEQGKISASKQGLLYNSDKRDKASTNLISWPEADKLLQELEDYEQV